MEVKFWQIVVMAVLVTVLFAVLTMSGGMEVIILYFVVFGAFNNVYRFNLISKMIEDKCNKGEQTVRPKSN